MKIVEIIEICNIIVVVVVGVVVVAAVRNGIFNGNLQLINSMLFLWSLTIAAVTRTRVLSLILCSGQQLQ